ncbi:hypothetical protein [Photobacterium leiognathi]|uniref:hypothetical protein n=1 Tax=Photobacterium leiognathi TaxID=553611 RepID=UPI0027389F22|nr:hypothetical protein [Photobacterium leiognathi]
MKNQLLSAVLGAIVGAIISAFGTPIVNDWLSSNKEPLLLSEISKPFLKSLDEPIRKQIKTITSTYSIQHSQGSTAEDITLIFKSSEPLDKKSIAVVSGADRYKLTEVSGNEVHIDFASIRPTGGASITIAHSPESDILFDHLIHTGQIIGKHLYENKESPVNNPLILITIMTAIIVTFVVLFIFAGHYAAKRFVYTEDNVSGKATTEQRIYVASIIIGIFIYNIVNENLQGSLPLPKISLVEVLCGVVLYLVLTNFANLKAALRKDV